MLILRHIKQQLGRKLQSKLSYQSCRRPSHHTHGGLQLSITLVPGNLTPSSDFYGHRTHRQYTEMQADKTFMHVKVNIFIIN